MQRSTKANHADESNKSDDFLNKPYSSEGVLFDGDQFDATLYKYRKGRHVDAADINLVNRLASIGLMNCGTSVSIDEEAEVTIIGSTARTNRIGLGLMLIGCPFPRRCMVKLEQGGKAIKDTLHL